MPALDKSLYAAEPSGKNGSFRASMFLKGNYGTILCVLHSAKNKGIIKVNDLCITGTINVLKMEEML